MLLTSSFGIPVVCHKGDNNAIMWFRLTFRSFINGAIKLTVCILRIIKASATHNTRVFVAFF